MRESAYLDVLYDALQHDCFEEVSNVFGSDIHVSAAPCPQLHGPEGRREEGGGGCGVSGEGEELVLSRRETVSHVVCLCVLREWGTRGESHWLWLGL
jgi:hypothetical protein